MRVLPLGLVAFLVACTPGASAKVQGSAPAVGRPSPPAVSTAPLEERGLANIMAFTRLYGYVRFFHPGEQSALIHWDSVAVEGMRRVERAPTADSLARTLRGIFAPIAPGVQIFSADNPQTARVQPIPSRSSGSLGIAYWRHEGVRTWTPEGPWQEVYQSGIEVVAAPAERVPPDVPDPRRPLRVDLSGGVSAWVPLARFTVLSRDSAHWNPIVIPFDSTFSADERAVRFASVAITWNVLQHFYPYFDVVQADWPAALRIGLRAAASDPGPRAFEQTLRRLLATTQDGHGGADLLPYPPITVAPFRAHWVEDQLVIVAVDDSIADRVRPGDVILAIDDRPTEVAFEDLKLETPGATLPWVRFSALGRLLGGSPGTPIALRLRFGNQSGAAEREISLIRNRRGFPPERRPAHVSEVGPGLAYVDLTRAGDTEFAAALPMLQMASGIIFDLRGYPRLDTRAVLAHLAGQTIRADMGQIPLVRWPDRKRMTFLPPDTTTFRLEPAQPRLTANIVFLTDERAISFSESTLAIVEGFRLGEIIGSATAGTNGVNNPFMAPGGYRITWTGMRVLKQDGAQLHGIGILPTIPVSRTIRGVADGRDEVLERAVAILEERARGR
jgi:hypothetical protein